MNNRLFTPGEILTIESNLREIEKNLGHSIPGGFIDASELKDHILRPGEVMTVCRNIESIGKTYNKKVRYVSNNNPDKLETIIGIAVLGIGAIILLFDFALGIDLLWWTH